MAATAVCPRKNREQVESELLAAVQFARLVWIESPENERDSEFDHLIWPTLIV